MSLTPQPEALTASAGTLVLSLFPGVGLLDRGFEAAGFCVVRGPDILWGGDVRNFHPPSGVFAGVIGGPPCQQFSIVNRNRDPARGMELVNEYLRIVAEAAPDWFLMENVPGSPTVTVPGFVTQVFTLDASHVGSPQHRNRKFHFGYRAGASPLVLRRDRPGPGRSQRTCLASEGKRSKSNRRDWPVFCRLQGLPETFDLPGFTVAGKYQAVGNGVPFPLAVTLARAIAARDRGVTPHRLCACGCGEIVTGRAVTKFAACRKRLQRERDAARSVTLPAVSQLFLAHEAQG